MGIKRLEIGTYGYVGCLGVWYGLGYFYEATRAVSEAP